MRLLPAGTALVTAIAFTSAGCASRAWPTRYTAAADPTFAARGIAVETVDVLPIDLEVWASADRADDGPRVRSDATATALGAISASLLGRGYRVASMIDWYGRVAGPQGTEQAMPADAVLATAGTLAAYGAAASRSPTLPVPALPVRLGEHSGADATLYVGGWSYLGEKPGSADDDLATAAMILIGVVAVVLIVAAISESGKSSKGGKVKRGGPSERGTSAPHWPRGGGHVARGGRGHGRGVGSLAGRAAGAIARTAVTTGRVALRTLARSGSVMLEVGHDATAAVADATFRGAYVSGPHPHGPIVPLSCDEDPYGPGCPSTVSAWRAPPEKGESELYLEMTLVDNRTGRVLWHARQLFPADGASQGDVQRAVTGLLSTLPTAP